MRSALKANFSGKKVFLRVDFNVATKDGRVTEDFRIISSLPLIEMLRDQGAKILLVSHADETLAPVSEYLARKIPHKFVADILSKEAGKAVDSMQNGEVILFENIRQHKEEEKNDKQFAEKIAALADVYINEAFSVSHRKHASIVSVPGLLEAYAGPLFEREVAEISKAFDPARPFLFVLGGAKFSTKMPLVRKFLEKADLVCVAGTLMNNLFQEAGYETGHSIIDTEAGDLKEILEHESLYLPPDVVVKDSKGQAVVRKPDQVQTEDIIMDVGPQTIAELKKIIAKSKFILWNGPLGNFEKGFAEGTYELAHRIAESGKRSLIGGGDTVAAISHLHLNDKFGFVSTGGGAMLDFLANETLPGIEALQ